MKSTLALSLIAVLLLPCMLKAGEIRVYDADDNFIGILLGRNVESEVLELFVPSLKKSVFIDLEEKYQDITIDAGLLGYRSIDCSGQHLVDSVFTGTVFWSTTTNMGKKYFTGSNISAQVLIKSVRDPWGNCYQMDSPTVMTVTEAVEVPLGEIPFPLPLAFPFRYEYCRGNDSDCDGDIDGNDLQGFANVFGSPP